MELDILRASSSGNHSQLVSLKNVSPSSTISDVKKLICKQKKSLYPERISLRNQAKGKALGDDAVLSTLDLSKGRELFFKDLGPQIGWSTVFLCEYAGPLFCYLITYVRPSLIYGNSLAAQLEPHYVVKVAALCWSFHYIKRILETIFVHRFSHSTMPLLNLFKNCSYYWGFAFYVGYYIHHPLYTPPTFGQTQIYLGLVLFILAELGNYSIHIALRDLRPPGTTTRSIPHAGSNPFTLLFQFVSCPNYTYEIGAWLAFTLMTQALPALLFASAGGFQMIIWALGKHRNYKKQFPNYPRGRKAIIPFLI